MSPRPGSGLWGSRRHERRRPDAPGCPSPSPPRHESSPSASTATPHHLQRVLRNLLDNAARHAREHVTIGLTAEDGTAELTVTDDGPGIPAGERERVFGRFVRLDDDRSRQGGTGLGLPIARDVVIAHGGTLTVHTAPVGGALLRIRLPLAPD